MRSYTDLNQSKKLAEILPLESADMYYSPLGGTHPWVLEGNLIEKDAVLCWSLAALLSVIPDVSLNAFKDGVWNAMVQHNDKIIYKDKDNPVDACVELIGKLHELKLL